MTRQCGGCTLCCKLIPVEELGKPAGMRCHHQRTGKGCAIYERRPMSCREWSCLWLKGSEADEPLRLSRPDRVHYVIDEVPDVVRMTDKVTGEVRCLINVLQVWVDPLYPDAWQDKQLLDLLERQGVVALVRYNSVDGFAVFPPSANSTGQWQRVAADSVANLEADRREARYAFWRQQLSAAVDQPAAPAGPDDAEPSALVAAAADR